MLLPFVELEFTHGLGPPAGRYVVRPPGSTPEPGIAATGVVPTLPPGSADVLVVRVEEAAGARRPSLRRPRVKPAVAREAPADVPLYLALALFATRAHGDRAQAEATLDGYRADPATAAPLVAEALVLVNRAIRAYRAAAADPYVAEVTRADARVIRVGYGEKGLADGAWEEAIALPPEASARVGRAARLRPTEIVADVLAGRRSVLAGDDVLLRAVLDFEQGRPDVAARQLELAIELLVTADSGLAARLSGAPERARDVCRLLGQDKSCERTLAALSSLATDVGEAIDAWRSG